MTAATILARRFQVSLARLRKSNDIVTIALMKCGFDRFYFAVFVEDGMAGKPHTTLLAPHALAHTATTSWKVAVFTDVP